MLLSITLLATACGDGTTSSASADDTPTADTADGGGHDHGDALEVPDGMSVPTVAVRTAPDSVKGINLFVELEDFRIAPEHASTDPVDGEGHLHLYVDGERVMRFYNTALHLGDLAPGERELTVEVSANDHRAYAVDGEPIRASTTVMGLEPPADGHQHGTDTVAAPEPPPTVALSVSEDPKSGWNVAVELAELAIAPEAEGTDPVDGEGHLHLYLDGERVTRLYGLHWHLPTLTEGTHEVMVEVSANDHRTYAVGDEPITASATVEVTAEMAGDHDDDHDEAMGDEHDDGDGDGDGDGEEHRDDDGEEDNDGHGDHGEAMDADDVAALGAPDQVIEASISEGEVTVSDDRFDVTLGSTVLLRVSADRPDEVHLHGYDVLAVIAPDQPAELAFVADTPGVFEVELEDAGTFLFEVAVR
ncbi:MAG: hypothetical protein AAFN30_01545 [Actinomycetota bacterium]